MRIALNYPCCYLYLTVSRVVGIWSMLCSGAFMGRDLQLTLLSQFSLNTFNKIMTSISLEHQKTISEVLVAQSCPTLCDPMDCGPPDFSVHGISQARTLGYFAISSSSGSSWSRDWTFDSCISCIGKRIIYHWVTREATSPFFIKTQMWVHLTGSRQSWALHHLNWSVWCLVLFALGRRFSSVTQSCLTLYDHMDCSTPGFPVHQQLLEPTQTHVHHVGDAIQPSPSNRLILCHPVLLLPSMFPSIRVFSSESVLHIRWPKYWSFSFCISPSNEYSGLISFSIDWLDLLAVQGAAFYHHMKRMTCSSKLRPKIQDFRRVTNPFKKEKAIWVKRWRCEFTQHGKWAAKPFWVKIAKRTPQ